MASALEENLLSDASPLPVGKVVDLPRLIQELREVKPYRVRGRVTEVTGLIIQAAVPVVRIGEMCWVKNQGDDDATQDR